MKIFLGKIFALKTKNTGRGFTLVELLVTISIFVVLTGVVLSSQNNFDNSILLSNLAYDTALTIRQAQSYGVNTKESSAGTFSSHGVYYDLGVSKTNFVLFADINNSSSTNSVISCSSISDPECIQKYSIKRGSFIKSICTAADSVSSCVNTNKLSIVFKRPNPDALIYNNIDSNGLVSGPSQMSARIVVSSPAGATSTIVVTSVGQIYVEKK